jgi:hypothetical protein
MRAFLLLIAGAVLCGACSGGSSGETASPQAANQAQTETAKEQDDIMNKGM